MLVILLSKPPGPVGGAGLSLLIAVPLSLVFALGIGYFNATVVERTGLPSFIVTLGSFFVLIGAKLGFAKLFTDKVIVEGLDEAAGYDFWVKIFGRSGSQQSHLESRDLIYAVLLIVVRWRSGSRIELSFADVPDDTGGLLALLIGAAAVFWSAPAREHRWHHQHWIYGLVVAIGVLTESSRPGIAFRTESGSGFAVLWRCQVRLLLIGSPRSRPLDCGRRPRFRLLDVIGFLITCRAAGHPFVGWVFRLGALFVAARRLELLRVLRVCRVH